MILLSLDMFKIAYFIPKKFAYAKGEKIYLKIIQKAVSFTSLSVNLKCIYTNVTMSWVSSQHYLGMQNLDTCLKLCKCYFFLV